MIKPFDAGSALSFRGRSPFQTPYQIGIPPAYANPSRVDTSGAIAKVDGVPLPYINKPADQFITNPPSGDQQVIVGQTANVGIYGDSGGFRVDLVAGVPQLVLKRPANTRVELLIQNLNAIGVLAYAFDNVPSVGGAINIAAGGNRLWDTAVPQGDLIMISAVNVTAVVEFMNNNLNSPRT